MEQGVSVVAAQEALIRVLRCTIDGSFRHMLQLAGMKRLPARPQSAYGTASSAFQYASLSWR